MKKIFAIALAVLFIGAGSSMACSGPECYGSGNFDIGAKAKTGGIDMDGKLIPNGAAGGVSGAAAKAKFTADGYVRDGEAEAYIGVTAGALYDTTAYKFTVAADKSIGVGSMSHAEGILGANMEARVEADRARHFFDYNVADADGRFSGKVAQGTLDGSFVTESPRFFDSEGFSGGIAGQGSIGGFEGGFDLREYGYGHDREDFSDLTVRIDMVGNSGSESYRYVDRDGALRTEGMGTNVFANTAVNTSYDHDRDSWVRGGFNVAGGAASVTKQQLDGGKAKATMSGLYTGAGSLGCNYNGSVTGYTYTSATTVDGLNGNIMSAGAGVSVTSHTSPNTNN